MLSQRGARGVAFERDRTPEALYELFPDWQRTQTQSSVTALESPRQQMDVGNSEVSVGLKVSVGLNLAE
jgi:hypothetical protein